MTQLKNRQVLPVVIVGAGPVGMGLALHLSCWGTNSVLVESRQRPLRHPRGNTHNCRTMELYRKLRIAREIRSVGLPKDYPTDVGYFTTFNGYELARLPMPSENMKQAALRDASPLDQVVEPIYRCNQMYVEEVLHQKVSAASSIDRKFGWECGDWTDRGDYVDVCLVEKGTAKEQHLKCAFLVGCDGGQSATRRSLDVRFSGRPFREQAYAGGLTASTYIRAPAMYRNSPHKPCWQYSIVNPRVRSNIVALDGQEEFLFSTRLKPEDGETDRQAIHRQLLMSVGGDIEYDYISHFTWTAGQALVADSYGAGRIFLAGDAIHLFTPQGGFGMNTGMDDVANLGWKLAAVVQGWGGPSLLRSYEQERRPVAIRNTSAAQGMARFIGDITINERILLEGPVGDLERHRTGKAFSLLTEEFGSLGIQLGARYENSDVICYDDAVRRPDDPHHYVPSSAPGGRCPHLWLKPGIQSLYDLFGQGFTLLCVGGKVREADAFTSAARRLGLPLNVLSINIPQAQDLYATSFVLVRPDCYVAWRGNAIPESCDAILAVVTGWGSHLSRREASTFDPRT